MASGFLNGENPRKYTDQVEFTIASDDSVLSDSISSPFLFQDVAAEVRQMSPWDNATYTGQVPLNITVRFSARSSLPNQNLIPYENISCIYQLDGGEWQNASLSGVSDETSWYDPTLQGYWNQQTCNYTALLKDLVNGAHALNVSFTPKLEYCYRLTGNGSELIYSVGEDVYAVHANATINFYVRGNYDLQTPEDSEVTAGQGIPLVGYVTASVVAVAASVAGILAIVKRCKSEVR